MSQASATTNDPARGITNEANLLAKLAGAGHAVHRGSAGNYRVSKYGLCAYCEDLEALRDFAARLGVCDDL